MGAGAELNHSARFAYIIVPESDSPRGLIYFAVGSRLAVAHKKTTLISLQVIRDSSTALAISVGYSTQVGLMHECIYYLHFFSYAKKKVSRCLLFAKVLRYKLQQ